jgi:hypothetical protein
VKSAGSRCTGASPRGSCTSTAGELVDAGEAGEVVELRGDDVVELPLEQPATAAADSATVSAAEVWRVSMIGTLLAYSSQSADGRLKPR